jgi:regulatory protein
MSEIQKSEKSEAWGWSLQVLQTAGKSCFEMHEKLNRKGYSDDVISQVMKQLQDIGYLNDEIFAQSIYRRYTGIKPSGKSKIIFELKRRKIPQDVVEQVLSTDFEEDEFLRAVEVAQKKWMSVVTMESRKRQKRVFDFLLRRGFNFQMARDAIRQLADQETEHESEIE